MWRLRVPIVCGASVLIATVVPIVLTGAVEAAAADPSVDTACTGTLSGTTFTLTANCDTTVALTVPNGQTVDGGGHTITAHDPAVGNFAGSVLTNAGTSMIVENLTIKGTGFATDCSLRQLIGIFFDNAGGSVSGVHVEDITQHSGCPLGQGIQANAVTGTPRTVTITNTVVSGYQTSALVASGMMTVNVSASTLGPPDSLVGVNTQIGVQYGGFGVNAGAGGTITGSTIYGSESGVFNGQGFQTGVAVQLDGAHGVSLSGDIITGAGTDIGVSAGDATGVVVTRNQIGRTAPEFFDNMLSLGVVAGPTTTVTCNTFSGWDYDTIGGVPPQPVCVTTTTLPRDAVGRPYSATLTAIDGTPPYRWSLLSGSLPPGLALSPSGIISGTPTTGGTFAFTMKATDSKGGTATQPLTISSVSQGYWVTAGDGRVFAFGAAPFHGSAAATRLHAPVVGMANTPEGGYWLATSDGGVFSYDTAFFGSLGGTHLNAPIVDITPTPDGGGYYLVGADGGVFTFGDAHFKGSMAGKPLHKPVVGIAVTPDNQGYYLVAADGGVFTFGDARFQGSMGTTALHKPVVGMAVDIATSGYWLVAGDGGLFSFGAPFFGSTGNIDLAAPVVGIAATTNDLGYRFVASDGGVFCFGAAHYFGSLSGTPLTQPAVGMVSTG
jgi:hypothetical protein